MSARDDAMKELTNGDLAAEMGWPVTWPEVKRLHGIIEALLAETEPEWEYGVVRNDHAWSIPDYQLRDLESCNRFVRAKPLGVPDADYRIVRRRKAGLWEEVTE